MLEQADPRRAKRHRTQRCLEKCQAQDDAFPMDGKVFVCQKTCPCMLGEGHIQQPMIHSAGEAGLYGGLWA